MTTALPARRRDYVNFCFDSGNWDLIAPRDGDIVITTSYKSGTTWMQNIVLRLVFHGMDLPAVSDVSPWIDRRRADFTPIIRMAQDQAHRRILKSHLPLDGIPYRPGTRYIVVVRDPRDVFMSLWNHLSNLTDTAMGAINTVARATGETEFQRPDDIHAFWDGWINRGTFPWESEGYPHSANLAHTQSWWNFRHLENIHFVHFNDLLSDPGREICGVAAHLGIDLPDTAIAAIARDTEFSALRRNLGQAGPMSAETADAIWVGGLERFFFQGTNGRWRPVLTPSELAMYERARTRVLTPDCAAYLECGRDYADRMFDHAAAGGFA